MARLRPVANEPLSDDEKVKADQAVEALTNLASSVLASGRRTRFSEAARICDIGQGLIQATSRRVADLSKGSSKICFTNDMEAYGDDEHDQGGAILYNAHGRLVNQGPLDEQQLLRDALLSLSKASTEQQKLSAIAASEAEELANLLRSQSNLGALSDGYQTIEKRVAQLFKQIEERNAVVYSDSSRGHPARSSGTGDSPQGDGADANGNGSDGSSPQEGTSDDVAQEAVG